MAIDIRWGNAHAVKQVAGPAMGLALCKDMHYAALGQAYGTARAGVMLVPAWDFQLDAWMGARMDAAAWRGKRLCGVVRCARRAKAC